MVEIIVPVSFRMTSQEHKKGCGSCDARNPEASEPNVCAPRSGRHIDAIEESGGYFTLKTRAERVDVCGLCDNFKARQR